MSSLTVSWIPVVFTIFRTFRCFTSHCQQWLPAASNMQRVTVPATTKCKAGPEGASRPGGAQKGTSPPGPATPQRQSEPSRSSKIKEETTQRERQAARCLSLGPRSLCLEGLAKQPHHAQVKQHGNFVATTTPPQR